MSKSSSIRDEYLSHIEKQKTSGLSIKRYCELNNLVEHKMSYYRSYKVGPKAKQKTQAFTKVQIKPKSSPTLNANIDPVWLAKLINQLFLSK